MITAIIRNKENTLVLELPHSIYDIYEKLQSIGIMQPPKQIPLTDNEGEDIGVKLFSESDFGQHLLLTLHEKNTIADANMLTLVIGAASEDIKEELEQQGVKCSEDSPEWTISRIRSILQNEKYCGDVLMQKTFRQDFINRKAIKNTGQLPMYLIENHHEGIVSREKYDAVQAEMARRNAAKSPSKNAVTGMASYASKYALSERLVCGECGTLYRRCTWTRNGEKRVVWRCVSRLDYGKKYCHNSPTLDEAPLQQAILAALNTAMADKNSLIRQITDAMETEIIPFPGGTMSLGDIERRLRELEQQFQTLLEKAADDPAAYGGQFKEILDEQTFLKENRSGILADNKEQAKANQRIMDAAQTLENASPHITEWDESAVRQLVETVKVLSKDEIAVTLKGGIEICQKIMY